MFIKSIELLNRLVGEGNWITITDLDYDSVVLSEGVEMPSREQFDKVKQEVETDYENQKYKELRQTEYPSLADFADAYYWSQKGDNSKMKDYLLKCDEVKNKYPKGAI